MGLVRNVVEGPGSDNLEADRCHVVEGLVQVIIGRHMGPVGIGTVETEVSGEVGSALWSPRTGGGKLKETHFPLSWKIPFPAVTKADAVSLLRWNNSRPATSKALTARTTQTWKQRCILRSSSGARRACYSPGKAAEVYKIHRRPKSFGDRCPSAACAQGPNSRVPE